jgi:hypothetical protein
MPGPGAVRLIVGGEAKGPSYRLFVRPVFGLNFQAAPRGRDWSVQMRFLKRLFRRQEKPAPPAVPSGVAQTEAQQDAARKHMEADVAADRKRRGATDKRR